MSANDFGIMLWNNAAQLVFDTTDYSGQRVGSLEITGTTGYSMITFNVPNVPDSSYVWAQLYYFNAEFWQYEGGAVPVSRTAFQYYVGRAPAGCITLIQYGFI